MPLVGVTANRLVDDGVHREWVRRRYIDALEIFADVDVVILPTRSSDDAEGVRKIACRLDGLVLTGDESNLDPAYFRRSGAPRPSPSEDGYRSGASDPFRDLMASSFLSAALAAGTPILGICRGVQELNVLFGGDLYEDISSKKGMLCHTEDVTLPRDRQYDPVHEVLVQPDGILAEIFDGYESFNVNSLHNQGISALGKGLVCEAVASDGLIEAVSVANARSFQLAVQWHPEWHVAEDDFSKKLFQAFGKACKAWRSQPKPGA
ncbi:gamma-glutamyl-gamma-aminobutyrate hydrolase family protein [Mesorhizobium sp. M1005]|uniref:gamma-glutamyl-gamma-aminobutyrate hydrolase family protein n=1 Tax=unclassified Mesorhizobium TaxID=325217 RepID=UPI00333DBC8F